MWAYINVGIWILLLLTFPIFAYFCERKLKPVKWLGTVLFAYLCGIILKNTPFFTIPAKELETITGLTVMIAVPLLLFSSDFIAWIKHAKTAVLAFVLAVFTVSVATIIGGNLFGSLFEEGWKVAGMFAGVYIGGTPNLAAIGYSLDISGPVYAQANAADVMISGIYMIFLMRIGKLTLSKFLPPFLDRNPEYNAHPFASKPVTFKGVFLCLLVAVGVVIISILTTTGIQKGLLVFGYKETLVKELFFPLVIVISTTLSVILSLSKQVRSMPNTDKIGDYLILAFCFGFGMQVDAERLFNGDVNLLYLGIAIVFGSAILYYILCAIFKIDVDTAIIVSSACIFSPPFVPAIAQSLKNPKMITPGMVAGVAGYAVGNYVGLALAYILKP